MKKQLLDKYFEKIKERLEGNNTSDTDIIDFGDNLSISRSEIEEQYYNYINLQNEIDDYVEDNDLDNITDRETIKAHFNKIDENCFEIGQAVLVDFVDYMYIILNKK